MDKRTLLAVLLILVVFWLSSEFIWKRNATTEQSKPSAEEQVTEVHHWTDRLFSFKTTRDRGFRFNTMLMMLRRKSLLHQ